MPRKKQTKTVAKTKTTTKTRKKKEMQFVDGKAEDKHEVSMDIEQILNPEKNPFGTNSIDELETKMEEMNLRQMQELAVQASVFPSGNRTSLKKKIKKEFSSKYGTKDSERKYKNSIEEPVVDPSSNLSKHILDILNGK